MAYTWIPFYKEFAQKLLKYRDDRTPLVNWIYGNIDRSLIKHFKDDSSGKHVPDTDPFTVMAIINRGITWEKKIILCKQFKDFLDISAPIPKDFLGVPEMNNMQSNFIGFEKDRKEGDIERLWDLFEAAVEDMNIKPEYDALNGQYLIKYNITMGLFWIQPDKYLALDGNNRENLEALGIASFKGSNFVTYDEYEKILKQLDAKMKSGEIDCSSYAEFSQMTYKQNDGASTRDLPKQDSINYWMYAPGEQARFWDEYYQDGTMGLGWNKIGDLRAFKKQSDLIAPLKQNYGSDTSQKNSADMLYGFANEMKPGDIVFAKKGRSMIVGRGVVTSDYYYDNSLENHHHLRKIKWTDKGEWKTDTMLAMKTLTNITSYKEHVSYLNRLIDGESNKQEAPSVQNYWWLVANPKIWSITGMKIGEEQSYSLYSESGHKRNIFQNFLDAKAGDIVLGYESSPTKQVVCLLTISKENDGEELYFKMTEKLPTPIDFSTIRNTPGLEKMEYMRNQQGSFFKVTADEFDIIMELVRGENPLPKKDANEPYTEKKFLEEVFVTENDFYKLRNLLLRKKNLILLGAPGVGKTFAARRLAYAIMGEKDESRVMQVQFHQNYSYEDFVMGYKPNENGGFDMKYGVFRKFCTRAAVDKEHKYFFIIDEINRGNLSKIFGELLMLIESDYRDKPIQLSYNDETFAVPSNIYIIGMMNTADRSLAMIDYALRRRFSFFEMKPGFETDAFNNYILGWSSQKLRSLINAIIELNKVITDDDSLGSGFCIGHSYLCNFDNGYDLESIVEYDIIPMLREYWFDNDDKFNQEAQKLINALK